MKKYIRAGYFFLIGSILIAASGFVSEWFEADPDFMEEAKVFASELDVKTAEAVGYIHDLRNEISTKGAKRTQLLRAEQFSNWYRDEGIIIVVFRNDELLLWSHNAVSPQSLKRTAALGTEIQKFENGWYRLVYFTDGIDEYIGAVQISQSYPYSNLYLKNGFRDGFGVKGLNDISLNPIAGSIKLKADHQSFYLSFDIAQAINKWQAWIYIILSLSGGILIFIALFSGALASKRKLGSAGAFTLFLISTLLLRWLSLHAGWPGYVSDLPFFNPAVYASSEFFPAFADLIINVLLLASLAFSARFSFGNEWQRFSKNTALMIFSMLAVLLVLFGLLINEIIKGLVLNSTIPFDINYIVELNRFSFSGIMAVALLYLSFFLLTDKLVNFARSHQLSGKYLAISILILLIPLILTTHYFGIRDLIFILWPPLTLGLVLFFRYFLNSNQLKVVHATFLIIVFAGVATHNFLKYPEVREHNERRVLADRLAVNDDPVAEILFREVEADLKKDQNIKELFYQDELLTRETLEDYILSRYFTGYWSKYEISLHPYLGDSSVWGKLPSVRPPSFMEIIRNAKQSARTDTLIEGMNFLPQTDQPTNYLGILELHYSLTPEPDGFFLIEFSPKLFPQQMGFPNLLIDQGTDPDELLSDYAMARYSDNQLTLSRGDYPYPSDPGIFGTPDKPDSFLSFRGFEHYISRFDNGDIVVISLELKSPLDKATTFSYICLFFGLILAIGFAIYNFLLSPNELRFNLNQKIQVLLVSLTLVTMVLFTLATRYYIERKYTEKNQRLISEKMQSILLELENKLGEEEQLSFDMSDYVNRLLSRFSYIFFTDINLYNPEGTLIGSSQMRMFNEGILSRKMNPDAYGHLHYLNEVEFIQEEYVGDLDYLSVYAPFYNETGELMGYVNVPYFARQTELTQEISSFLIAVVNLFALLFVLSIVIGLFVSQWITLPLRSLRESLSAIELGKTTRLIGYSGKDEIGLLVEEYNAKVAELEHNAERLARSERESAWREMAKQVAHEIKNPLTPMKLSVQHLQRYLVKEGEMDAERIQKLTDNLVDQIDTLSSIATAFSNFARMPHAKKEKVDMSSIIAKTIGLYDGFERIEFSVRIEQEAPVWVLADRDQLLRVFNNLIKNAVQSIPDHRKGKIGMHLFQSNDGYQIDITDNGTGINASQREKIFVPNFTTKSRGMGLGLAMTKNIVEEAGGRIWFTSNPGEGSTFSIWLPRVNE